MAASREDWKPAWDDAIHIIDPYSGRITLCGQPLMGQNLTRMFGPQPSRATGCWTCMDERERRCDKAEKIIRRQR